jgi:hypothetical protein
MPSSQDINSVESPLEPDDGQQMQPPLSGTVDDNDEQDDERWDENEAPVRALNDKSETRGEFRLDAREEDADIVDGDIADVDENEEGIVE